MTPEEYKRETTIIHTENNINNSVGFVYVPKTGGTYLSMSPVPQQYYKDKKHRLSKLPSSIHMPVSKIESIVDNNVPIFTMIRDPYDRICSEYYFVKGKAKVTLDYMKGWDLEDPRKLNFLAHKTGRIMGNPDFSEKTYNIHKYNMSIEEYLEWSEDNPTYPFYYDTKTPKDFDVVGITEKMEDCIKILKEKFNLEIKGGHYNNNLKKRVGKKYKTGYSRKKFKNNNLIDYEMYYEGLEKYHMIANQTKIH